MEGRRPLYPDRQMEYKWLISEWTEEELALRKHLASELHISEAGAGLLVKRGITCREEASAYVHPSLDDLNDPFLMRDMDKATERLNRAISAGEKILVYGDYDVDGTTAVALTVKMLSGWTNRLDYYVPDRYTEGYGISFRGIDYAQEQGCTLIVALDCGIKDVDKVEYAKQRGIDFIICDHHTPGDTIPKAVAVLNMKRHDCPYPYKELSGCGVGFKLMQAMVRYRGGNQETLDSVLSYLAMSIASDIVPVTGENRILAYYGLKRINEHPLTGIKSLLAVAGLEDKKVTISDLAFKIGPRINASGRMRSGTEAVKLLLADNEDDARKRAQEIDTYNKERQECDSKTIKEALDLLQADPDNDQKTTTVVYSPNWHRGVVGISASRLTETYYRPTVVLTDCEDGLITGSARSAGGFDLYSAIDSCRDLLTHFGGHRFAAGLSMPKEHLPLFKERFEHYVATHIQEEQRTPVIHIEQQISLQDITPQFINLLKHLEPFGPDNPRPIFLTRQLINNRYTKRVGKTGEHLRLDVTDRTAAITGIAFGKGDMAMHLQNGNSVDICYELEENTYNHITTIQMMVQDIQICSTKETPKDL